MPILQSPLLFANGQLSLTEVPQFKSIAGPACNFTREQVSADEFLVRA